MKKPRRLLHLMLLLCLLLGAAVTPPAGAQTLYWETPRVFVPQGMASSRSDAGPNLMGLAWQDIQPKSTTDRTSGNIYLSLAVSHDGINWTPRPRFFGPITYTGVTEGSEPRVYSMVIDAADHILVAVTTSDREITILQSTDEGKSFQRLQKITAPASTGVPDLFSISDGGFLLLVSEGSSNADVAAGSVTLAYSRSRDARLWTPLAPFVTAADGIGSPQIQPAAASFRGRDYVVFESLSPRSDLTSTWQLYAKRSVDGGATWEKAVPITSTPLAVAGKAEFGSDPLAFDNERPRLSGVDDGVELVWERSPYGSNRSQIWGAHLDGDAAVTGAPEIVAADTPARFAQFFQVRGTSYVIYSDASRATSRISLARRDRTWQPQLLQNTDVVNALFPHAVVFKGSLFIFWENQASSGGLASLVQLRPLTSVGAPVVKPVDFDPGQAANRDNVTVSWTEPQPPDPSGIRDYRYTWSYSDGTTTVQKESQTVSGLTAGGRPLFSSRKVDKDGTWTFSVVAEDLAGNVSSTPATVSFVRDATPPGAVSFQVLALDGSPLLDSPPEPPGDRTANARTIETNSFTIRWAPSGDKDVVGYTYNLQPGWSTLADYQSSPVPLVLPPSRVVTTGTSLSFTNRDNGVYALTVRAVDKAGNLSPPSTLALELSRYQVVTRVDLVTVVRDPVLGSVSLTILGRGFRDNGLIRKVILDRGGHQGPPYDIELDPAAPLTITDRQISGITLDDNRESGAYRVGLLQDRPTGQQVLYITPAPMFEFRSPGTVKIGNFQVLLPTWIAGPSPQYLFSFDALIVLLVVALLAVLSVLAFRKVVELAQEGAAVRAEVVALLESRPNPRWEERKRRMQALKRKGMGLRLKFTLLMVVLVTMIVLIVSVPLGFQMVSRQRISLTSGLQNSANILLGALASSAETQIRQTDQGFFGAPDMPNLRSTMPEAVYTTITGPSTAFRPTDPKDFVWASDQKRFADELKAGQFRIATETVDDELARSVVPALQQKIDTDLGQKLGPLVEQWRTLHGQQANLLTRSDAASRAQLTALNDQLDRLGRDIDTQAKSLYGAPHTLEPFNPAATLRPTYVFYRPVIFYNRAVNVADTTFYQGMIRLQVRADTINRQITDSITAIIRTAGAIALAAIALGFLGAIIMASITVTPIRRLAQGVAVIRDTEDKEKLHDHVIEVRTRDEIGSLAETVNEMTQGLVKAAAANKLLLEGIDVQKQFLPLMKDAVGGEASTAQEETQKLEIFGYYKGAKGVSGDYFDFKRLDDTYYALIKCDVSGKGVAAALIMVEVATLFINYFRDWPKRKENITRIKDPAARQKAHKELERLDALVYTINDMVEERGFRGRFAALTVCLFNSATGVVTVCNAGDTKLNLFSADKRVMVHTDLPSAPAAGSFPSMLVEMKTPYRHYQQRLASGDVLFLHTDGFEESKRKLRGPDFQYLTGDEDFSEARIDEVIAAVFNRRSYTLARAQNPVPNEELVFDFSSCEGTVREAVLALVAVEKVYRMVPDPALNEDSKVTMEAKVAEFLKDHFVQYTRYFARSIDGAAGKGTVTFTNALEEDQYDDLTIIALRRK